MQRTYEFRKSKDFALGLFPALLIDQIEASASISATCQKVDEKRESDVVRIKFSKELSLGEQNALSSLIEAHTAAFVDGVGEKIFTEAHNGKPSAQDDFSNGYPMFSIWFDISSRNAYISVRDDTNNAVWDIINPKTYHFEAFDLDGDVVLNSGYTALTWDTVVLSENIYQLSKDSSVIQINATGWFEIRAEITTDIVWSSSRSTSMARIALNTGRGFEGLPGAKTYMYNRTSNAGYGSGCITRKFYCKSGYQIRVEATKESGGGNIRTVPETCRIAIKNIKPLESE